MVQISKLIEENRIACNVEVVSKKRALEQLSALISEGVDGLSEQEVFESLLARERLGVTGVGHGVAIPHGRLKNSSAIHGALIKLKKGIDYESTDGQPVDIMFALLVPDESNDAHLKALAELATMFREAPLRESIREASSAQAIHQLIHNWQPGQ